MKSFILLIIISISAQTASSQDIFDPQPLIDTSAISILEPKTNQFIKGWNWWSIGRKLDSVMLMDFYHTNNTSDLTTHFPEGQLRIQKFDVLTEGQYKASIFQALAIQLEPTLRFYADNDSTKYGFINNYGYNDFKPRKGDTTGAVFGFRNINDAVVEIPNAGVDFDRAILRKNNLTENSALVFSNPFPQNEMILKTVEIDPEDKNLAEWDGTKWYLSINIKNLEPITAENKSDTVLILKVPYDNEIDLKFSDSIVNNPLFFEYDDYIKFERIPKVSGNIEEDTIRINSSFSGRRKGIARRDTSTQLSNEFIITGAMLDANGIGSNNSTITLSALFLCDSLSNPYLADDQHKNRYIPKTLDAGIINLIGLEVYYYGNIDVAIDWIRFETPHAQDLFRGVYDSTIESIITARLNDIANLRDGSIHIHRFYGMDEFWVQNWMAQRYYNKLTSGMQIAEIQNNLSFQLTHCTEMQEVWTGSTINFSTEVSVPYIFESHFDGTNASIIQANRTLNISNGFSGFWNATPQQLEDTLNSFYETAIYKSCCAGSSSVTEVFEDTNKINVWELFLNDDWNKDELYDDYYQFLSPMMSIERILFKNFYTQPSFLYSDKKWIANVWGNPRYMLTEDSSFALVSHGSARAMTGEEFRLKIWSPLLLGAKGLMYYWGKSDALNLPEQKNDGEIAISSLTFPDSSLINSLPEGNELVMSNLIGGDFFNFGNDPSTFNDHVSESGFDFDKMGINSDRLYTGSKSMRYEITKIHKWIEANEEELMSLHLKAWFGKGYMKMKTQHPDYDSSNSNSMIDKYFDLSSDSTYTSRIYDPVNDTFTRIKEDSSEQFFDLTIFSHDNDSAMTHSMYVGVLNRRTDPLLHYFDSASASKYMLFLTTAEFDSLAIHGGTNPTNSLDTVNADTWRQWYYKRLGCRELTLDFNHPWDGEYYIEEIEMDDPVKRIVTQQTGIGRPINRWLRSNDDIKITLLPGEGKLFRITKKDINADSLLGELQFPNQTKIVAYPDNFPWNGTMEEKQDYFDLGLQNKTFRYHITYHTNTPYRVFYRQSEPYSLNPDNLSMPYDKIKWEEPIPLSDTTIYNSHHPDTTLAPSFWEGLGNRRTLDCYNPAIIVRNDPTDGRDKAYIVSQCEHKIMDVDSIEYYWGTIIQNVIPINDLPVYSHAEMIGFYNCGNNNSLGNQYFPQEYGHPMINASRDGNYIVWADSIRGIMAAFQANGSTGWLDSPSSKILSIKDGEHIVGQPTPKATHPSLNPYSRIIFGEDDCAVVWQESPHPDDNQRGILYTRLNVDTAGCVYNYLSPNICADQMSLRHFNVEINPNKNIAKLHSSQNDSISNRAIQDGQYPSIHRSSRFTDFRRFEDSTYLDSKCYDFVYWEGKSNLWGDVNNNISKNVIYHRQVFSADFDSCTGYLGPYIIHSRDEDLYHPNPGPGTWAIYREPDTQDWMINDSLAALTFIKGSQTSGELYHLHHGYWHLFNLNGTGVWGQADTTLEDYTRNSGPIPLNGKFPHLSQFPFYNDAVGWGRKRRIYSDGNYIKVSAQYFDPAKDKNNRKKQSEVSSLYLFGFQYKNKVNLFSLPLLISQNNKVEIILKQIFVKNNGSIGIGDTIYTNWIGSKSLKKLKYFNKTEYTEGTNIFIQRQSDMSLMQLSPEAICHDRFILKSISLANGGDDLYRLLYVNSNPQAQLNQQILLTELPDIRFNDDTALVNPKNDWYDINEEILDISFDPTVPNNKQKLNIYPNPAKNYIDIVPPPKGNGVNQIFEIYDMKGYLLYTESSSTNSVIRINIKHLSPGSYILRCFQHDKHFSRQTVIKTFTVVR